MSETKPKSIPQGLYYFPEIIPEALYQKLDQFLKSDEFKTLSFNVNPTNPNSRQVAHFGYKYSYQSGNIFEKTHDFPPVIQELAQIILEACEDEDINFNQCIINRYLPGQGIGKHVDRKEYGPEIVCFTLGSPAEMEFNRPNHPSYKLYPENRSLYIMTGESRYKWTHEMRPRKSDPKRGPRGTRYSLTFRSVPK